MIYKTPRILTKIYPSLCWEMPTEEKKIYLTFDDGPIPEITENVLEILEKFQALATFFCIGDNVEKHPEVFKKIVARNHQIGNHTFNHLNGWKTNNETYLENIKKCNESLEKLVDFSGKKRLFRPPYGRIGRQQIKTLLPDYKIVMWSVLSMDYDKNIAPKQCTKKTIEHTKNGSIVVFHDSLKAAKNMLYALPILLETFTEKGFIFEKITTDELIKSAF